MCACGMLEEKHEHIKIRMARLNEQGRVESGISRAGLNEGLAGQS